ASCQGAARQPLGPECHERSTVLHHCAPAPGDVMALYWLVYRLSNQIYVVIQPAHSLIYARLRASIDGIPGQTEEPTRPHADYTGGEFETKDYPSLIAEGELLLMEHTAIDETLAYYAFPEEHWRRNRVQLAKSKRTGRLGFIQPPVAGGFNLEVF